MKTTLLFCKGNGLVSNLKVGCGKRGCHGGKQRCYPLLSMEGGKAKVLVQ